MIDCENLAKYHKKRPIVVILCVIIVSRYILPDPSGILRQAGSAKRAASEEAALLCNTLSEKSIPSYDAVFTADVRKLLRTHEAFKYFVS